MVAAALAVLGMILALAVVPAQGRPRSGAGAEGQVPSQPQATVPAPAEDPDPARFAADFEAFAEYDAKNSAPKDAVLFVGSSSIRLWPTAERFPGLTVINRGFGGSHISDVNHYLDAAVLKYSPAVVVFYAGDNDIQAGKSPDRIVADYRHFVMRVHAARADTDIVYIPIKPSLARWDKWPLMQEANGAVQKLGSSNPRLHYADVVPGMLGSDGRPRPELFVEDGLHMTRLGYDIWTDVVGRTLDAVLRRR
jgi:lysophospholipase L1-like esterase